jgi:hypothetical protein
MSTHCIHYGEHVEHVETPDLPHHIAVGGYPELAQQHCKLEERVAQLEALVSDFGMHLARLCGHVAHHVLSELPEDEPQ